MIGGKEEKTERKKNGRAGRREKTEKNKNKKQLLLIEKEAT